MARRYIDADEAKKVINGIDSYFAKFIDDIPTADVVEVVRCKDCADWQTDWTPSCGANGSHYCATRDTMTKPNDYCSYGERNQDDEIH